MKKLLSLVLALAIAFSLSSCLSDDSNASVDKVTPVESSMASTSAGTQQDKLESQVKQTKFIQIAPLDDSDWLSYDSTTNVVYLESYGGLDFLGRCPYIGSHGSECYYKNGRIKEFDMIGDGTIYG